MIDVQVMKLVDQGWVKMSTWSSIADGHVIFFYIRLHQRDLALLRT